MNSLFLIRGLPGSGKSTIAKELCEGGKYPVFSIDDYFTDSKTGTYDFKFDKNHIAYKQCEENTRKKMEEGSPKIFVDNVFLIDWEMETYFKLAQQFNYRIFVFTVENRHNGKNIHQITEEQLQKMAAKYKVVLL